MSSFYQDASLVMIPSGYKTSKVYSAVPTDGTGDLTFTRSNDTATRVNSAGLIEKVRTNLVLQSQTFDNASWTKTAVTATANSTTAPDGTTTAETITETATSAQHQFLQSVTTAASIATFSIYLKANGRNFATVYPQGTSMAGYATVDLSNGIINSTGGSTFLRASIQSAGNGWYRIQVALTTTANPLACVVYISNVLGGVAPSYLGDGTSGIYAWGAQLETGDIATDYIPTTTAAVSVGPVANVPRLDYLNSSCPRLLLEPQRVNIFPNSETTATWSFTNMTRTGNHGIAPDGYQSADLLAPTTSGAVIFTSDSTTSSLTIGQPFVCSFFIKLNQSFNSNIGQNIIDIRLGGAAMWTRPTVRINLVTGSVTAIQNASYLSSTNYGNGWFRITFGGIPTGTSASTQLQIPTGTTMDGGSFYIWGLQGEANATYATSYIPTLGAAVTRGADAASKTGISSLIGQTEGTIFVDFNHDISVTAAADSRIQLSNGTAANWIFIGFPDGADKLLRMYVNSTSGALSFFSNTGVIQGRNKAAFAYKSGDFMVYLNGVQVASNTTAHVIPPCSAINLQGGSPTAVTAERENINQALLFKTRLTNAQLAELTTL